MSTPEQEMKIMNDPASCARQCSYRGEGKCSFESCPYDEFPMHKGQSTVDICPICGTKITRPQLDHLPILCDKCITRLRKILTYILRRLSREETLSITCFSMALQD